MPRQARIRRRELPDTRRALLKDFLQLLGGLCVFFEVLYKDRGSGTPQLATEQVFGELFTTLARLLGRVFEVFQKSDQSTRRQARKGHVLG